MSLRAATSVVALTMSAAAGSAAFAQEVAAPVSDAGEEIVVTARLRSESAINAPVVISSMSQTEIERRGISSLDSLSASIPQLIVAEAAGSAQGGVIAIRGIGVGEGNAFQDQAVSFNVDGVQIAKSAVRRMGEIDMAQIDVLKGPQALYFGKNSPAGLIVIRSADPGADFEGRLSASYDFVARQIRGEGVISTPLTDTLGARLAFYGAAMRGYVKNLATPDPLMGPAEKWGPKDREWGGRLTLLFQPSDAFTARFKFNHARLDNSAGLEAATQLVDCPLGAAQLAASDDCRADDRTIRASFGPGFNAAAPDLYLGRTSSFYKQRQTLGSLELGYRIDDFVKLTAITGYYDVGGRWGLVFPGADASVPNSIGGSAIHFTDREWSQELRLASDFEGPLNFQIGAFYQSTKMGYAIVNLRNPVTPAITSARADKFQFGDAYSAFGQLTWRLADTIEITGGARYSYEKKRIRVFDASGSEVIPVNPSDDWENVSPEATIAWRPRPQLTIFASYKTGFLSGGYSAGAGGSLAALQANAAYDQQNIKGFEAGAKGLFFDGGLRASLAMYRYNISGLQTTTSIVDASGFPQQFVVNAGRARSEGVELDLQAKLTPSLSLRSSAGYNRSRYLTFRTACYAGQSVAAGCDLFPNPSGAFTTQDLAGEPLVRAPKWSAMAGATYAMDLARSGRLEFSADVNYSSAFFGESTNKPGSRQSDFAMLDAGLTYTSGDERFSLGLLGKNLTNKYVFYRTSVAPFTGSGTGTSAAVPSDTLGSVSRGREIIIRSTVRF